MKRIACVSVCAAVLCAALLAGCGGASSAAPASSAAGSVASSAAASAPSSMAAGAPIADLNEPASAILAANPISNQFTFTDTNMKLDLALAETDYTGYYAVKSNDQGDAGTVIVIAAADGQKDAVVSALEAYRDAQASQFANYAEFADAQANMENAIIEASDNGVCVMAVPSNECTDTAALQSAVDGVVG